MPYTENQQRQLLWIARESIQHGVDTGGSLVIDLASMPEALKAKRATFVTLYKDERLRGCIGNLQADYALAEDVSRHAYAAAFQDPRFNAVEAAEVDDLEISISVLSPATPIEFSSEDELLQQIQPGIDGLVLEAGNNKGVFLPSVWEQLPDRKEFLRHLKNKAGLPQDYWSGSIRVSRFKTEYIS